MIFSFTFKFLRAVGLKANPAAPTAANPRTMWLKGQLSIWNRTSPKQASARKGLPFEIAIHSKWLAIRNDSGITPKGPMGPSPPRAPKAPLGPFGSLGPLGPFGSLWSLWSRWSSGPLAPLALGPGWWGGVSAPCRGYKRASRDLGGGANIDGDNKPGRRECAPA